MGDPELKEYIEVLGLQPNATLEQLKEAYKDLIKVWHPDRFTHDPKLQAKAQDKVKEINNAYHSLREHRLNWETTQANKCADKPATRSWAERTDNHQEFRPVHNERWETLAVKPNRGFWILIIVFILASFAFATFFWTESSLFVKTPSVERTKPLPRPTPTLEPPELSEKRRQFAINLPSPPKYKDAKYSTEGTNNNILVLIDDKIDGYHCQEIAMSQVAKEALSVQFTTLTCRAANGNWSIPLPFKRNIYNL